jgi:hypothetical protein
MNDRKKQRLELLYRLREMHMEQARADHVAAQSELEKKRERAEDTQTRLQALDSWAAEKMAGGAALIPEVLRQAQLYRGVEKQTLEKERAAEAESRERTEGTRVELNARFEELSVVERLTIRHAQAVTNEQIRVGYVALDEAGAQRKNQEVKE